MTTWAGKLRKKIEIDRLLGDDIAAAVAGAKMLVSASAWSGSERREVLVEMVFQLGRGGVG